MIKEGINKAIIEALKAIDWFIKVGSCIMTFRSYKNLKISKYLKTRKYIVKQLEFLARP